jgi:hypothetical protein
MQSSPAARHGMHLVIISQFEANLLKPILMRQTANPRVYLRAYLLRTSLSFPSFEDLATYVILYGSTHPPVPPKQLVTERNLFASRLYLRSYAEYVRTCRYLGLAHAANEGDGNIAADVFVGRDAGREGYEG